MSDLLPLILARRGPGRIRPRLDQLRTVLDTLGRPQDRFTAILVAGTNGKGSTAAMTEAVLAAHGLSTGLYTSPHLVRVEERVRIGGLDIARSALEGHLAALEPWPELSFFEALTAAAFLAFAEAAVEVAVLEVGMGGRWDATRLADPRVAGLTNIGTDHREWLGDTPAAIAAEKGAALTGAEVAVLGPGVDPGLVAALGVEAPRWADALVALRDTGDGRLTARWDDRELAVSVPLAGRHQVGNLHLALALLRGAVAAGILPRLEPAAVRAGLAAVRWPGRLSRHRVAGREVLVDAAHNLEAAESLAAYLEQGGARPDLLFSCLADKPLEAMAAVLRPRVGAVAVFPLADERAMPLDRLAAAFPGAEVAADLPDALGRLRDPVLAAGSLRVVGAVLEYAEAMAGESG